MNNEERAFIDNAVKLGNMIQLIDFVDPSRAKEMRQKAQPAIRAAMDLNLRLLGEGHIILGCQLQLASIPDENKGNLAKEVDCLLKASCWNQEEQIHCALVWARNRIQNQDISENDLAEVVSLWPTTDATIEYGMLCLSKAISRGDIKVEIR